MNKIKKFVKINGIMECKSGLSILGSKTEIGPGGVDNAVVKDPLYGLPYVPGTSIKGKMRSQLEVVYGKSGNKGTPCGCGQPDCVICTLFGAHMNTRSMAGTPRLLFRDMSLVEGESQISENLIEVKAETMVNRESHTAANGSLRERERVAKGTRFNFEIVLQVFEGDNEKKNLDIVKRGLELIENTGLGGKTSGGYGQVKFEDIKTTSIDAMTGKEI
jgi:CRISPR-associated protein Csm3